jgi:hypothetical protein
LELDHQQHIEHQEPMGRDGSRCPWADGSQEPMGRDGSQEPTQVNCSHVDQCHSCRHLRKRLPAPLPPPHLVSQMEKCAAKVGILI